MISTFLFHLLYNVNTVHLKAYLVSLFLFSFLCLFLVVILLSEMAPKHNAGVLSSVAKCKRSVMCLSKKLRGLRKALPSTLMSWEWVRLLVGHPLYVARLGPTQCSRHRVLRGPRLAHSSSLSSQHPGHCLTPSRY